MNTNGKRARRESGQNRHDIKRSVRRKRHKRLNASPYDPKIGTNARVAERRRAEQKTSV